MSSKFKSRKIFKLGSLIIITLFLLLDIKIFEAKVHASKKLISATEKDLYLYKGIGASYLCIASKAGIEFPKALGIAATTYVQVIEGKHGGLVEELGDKKLKREQLFAGAEFQIVTTAMQYCPDSVPEEVTKKVTNIIKENKK